MRTTPYKFLADLAHMQLPVTVQQPGLVDQLRSYATADLVHADIPDVVRDKGHMLQPPARVFSVTPEGLRTLRRLKRMSS